MSLYFMAAVRKGSGIEFVVSEAPTVLSKVVGLDEISSSGPTRRKAYTVYIDQMKDI